MSNSIFKKAVSSLRIWIWFDGMSQSSGLTSNKTMSVYVSVKVQKSDHPHSWDPCVNYCHPPNSTLSNTSSTLNKPWTASNNNTINSLDYCKCKHTNTLWQHTALCQTLSLSSCSSVCLFILSGSVTLIRWSEQRINNYTFILPIVTKDLWQKVTSLHA